MENTQSTNPLLAATSRWTAGVRALESARPDGLFKDPWAAALAGPEGVEWAQQRPADKTSTIALRTRYFDDFLQRTMQETPIRQVVLMAAGLDTRAYRLPWPEGTTLYELDQPDVLRYKDGVLADAGAWPACARRVIGQDLAGPWAAALLDAGFTPPEPSLWLLEGFLFYLPSARVTSILEELNPLASPESWLGFDINNSAMLTHPLTRAWVEMQAASGAPWIGTLDEPVEFLAGLGWKAALTQAGQPDANHGRWSLPVVPTTLPGIPHNWFVTAQKISNQSLK